MRNRNYTKRQTYQDLTYSLSTICRVMDEYDGRITNNDLMILHKAKLLLFELKDHAQREALSTTCNKTVTNIAAYRK